VWVWSWPQKLPPAIPSACGPKDQSGDINQMFVCKRERPFGHLLGECNPWFPVWLESDTGIGLAGKGEQIPMLELNVHEPFLPRRMGSL